MMAVAICFIIPHSKKGADIFLVFFERLETSKQTIENMCRLANEKSVYYSD